VGEFDTVFEVFDAGFGWGDELAGEVVVEGLGFLGEKVAGCLGAVAVVVAAGVVAEPGVGVFG
jgi:hypothetical protein